MYTPEEKQWGMLANILPLVISFFSGLGWVVSLIIYLIYKDKSRFVAFHALQSPILAGIAANNGELYEMPVVGKMARTAVGI